LKLRIAALAAAGVLGASAFAAGGIAGPEFKNKYAASEQTEPCGDDDVTYTGPPSLWPPNHKMQDVALTATDADDDHVTLETMAAHEEFVDGEELNGSGNTSDDVSPAADADSGEGTATTNHALRSERSGRGDCRVYTIDFIATFDDGSTVCYTPGFDGDERVAAAGTGAVPADPFEITVPHDMSGGANWK
jgi:hypothetical protein